MAATQFRTREVTLQTSGLQQFLLSLDHTKLTFGYYALLSVAEDSKSRQAKDIWNEPLSALSEESWQKVLNTYLAIATVISSKDKMI